jgi:hypothetical protein
VTEVRECLQKRKRENEKRERRLFVSSLPISILKQETIVCQDRLGTITWKSVNRKTKKKKAPVLFSRPHLHDIVGIER